MFWLAIDSNASSAISIVQGNLGWLIGAIVLIIIAVLVLAFLKNILVNSVLGLVAWAILHFVFHVQLSFWLSLVISALFGLAGIGVLLVLKFFGLPV